jgi:hypothetical protein
MFRKLCFYFFLFLVTSISSCTKSKSLKDVYCFLSDLDIDFKYKIHLCVQNSIDFSDFDYSMEFMKESEFALGKVKAGEFLLFSKSILLRLRDESKLKAIDVAYIAENKHFFLYQKRDRFLSRNYGEIGKISTYSLLNGLIKFNGNRSGKNSFYQINPDLIFPFTLGENLNSIVGKTNLAECRFKIKGDISGTSASLINNFKSEESISLYYKKNVINFRDTSLWTDYSFDLKKMDNYVKSDKQKIYFSNNKRTPYKIKYFEINVIDPYRGESRFNGELIWSNSYSINLKNQKWQKSSTWSIKDGFKCREIKPKHTGVHFSSNIASNSLEVEDEFVFDFQYQNEIESDSIFLVLKIFNENSELKDETIKKIGESRSWKKESLSIKISKNVNVHDRVMFYFKNDSDHKIYLKDMCAGLIRKNIICN